MSLVAGVMLAGIAAVAFTAVPAAASTAAPAQSVTLEQTGGIAGEHHLYTVTPNTADNRRGTLLSRLGQSDFLALDDNYGPTSVECCDRFAYQLTVRYANGQVKSVATVDGGGSPELLRETIDLTRAVATSSGSVRTLTDHRSLLFVQLVEDEWAFPQWWSISCEADGAGPAACTSINSRTAAALAPVPSEAACTRIYGGPEVARVFGYWQGQWVSATFTRNDGCEINRWNTMAALLTPVS